MHYSLSADVEESIRQHVASGRFADENELLREALAALDRQEEEIDAIREGLAEMEAGCLTPIQDFDAAWRRQHKLPTSE